MKSGRKILVTLQQPELFRRSRKVLVTPDGDGQLPTRIIDPVDRRGHVITGEWTEPVHELDAECVSYRWAGATSFASSNQELRTV
jgi:hypothetical protein